MRLLQFLPVIPLLASAFIIQPRANTITIDPSTTYQKIIGFGFSEAFGHAKQLYNLDTGIRQQVLDILFNTTSGAGLTILRNIITTGGIEPTSPSSASKTPTYTWDGSDNEQVWLSKTVQDNYGVKTIYANAWSVSD
jgi:O-glycosyl hydrolase